MRRVEGGCNGEGIGGSETGGRGQWYVRAVAPRGRLERSCCTSPSSAVSCFLCEEWGAAFFPHAPPQECHYITLQAEMKGHGLHNGCISECCPPCTGHPASSWHEPSSWQCQNHRTRRAKLIRNRPIRLGRCHATSTGLPKTPHARIHVQS